MQAGMTQKFTANSQDQEESSSEDEDSTDPGKSHKPLTQGGPGHFQFLKHQKQVRFQQTHNQSLRLLFLTMSWDLCAKLNTPDAVLVFL